MSSTIYMAANEAFETYGPDPDFETDPPSGYSRGVAENISANTDFVLQANDLIYLSTPGYYGSIYMESNAPGMVYLEGTNPTVYGADFKVVDTSPNAGSFPFYETTPKYSGPVVGISNQFVVQNDYASITPDNLNITALEQNVFIHTGSGEDAIDVSQVNGNNILDGSTGSNFLKGGTGNDTFFVDDRNSNAITWSTIANFHSGDNMTMWGVDQNDFNQMFLNNLGAAGYTGLTIDETSKTFAVADARVTFAGYTVADLSDGKLSLTFGHDSASNSNYLYIHGN